MKRIFSLLAALTIALSCTVTTASAQDFPGTTAGTSTNVLNQIKKHIETFAKYYGIDLSKDNPNIATPNLNELLNAYSQLILNPLGKSTVFSASFFNGKLDQPSTSSTSNNIFSTLNLTQQAIKNLLTTPSDIKNVTKCRDSKCIPHTTVLSNLASLGIPTAYDGIGSSSDDYSKFDANTLLGPLKYRNDLTSPLNFIRFATNPAMLPLDYSALRSAQVSDDPNVRLYYQNYLVGMAQYAALSSIGISNFNQMYARRLEKGDGSKSQAEAEYDIATRRMTGGTSNQWQTAMKTAPPIVLQREMLFLLNEINHQMYLNRVQQERILATLSAMQVSSANQSGAIASAPLRRLAR